MSVWSRRTLLKAALAAGAAWPLRARAFGDASRLVFAQIRHNGRWDPRPDGLPRLAWEVAKRTSIETSPIVRALSAADPDVFRYPFVVLSSDVALPPMADAEVSALPGWAIAIACIALCFAIWLSFRGIRAEPSALRRRVLIALRATAGLLL